MRSPPMRRIVSTGLLLVHVAITAGCGAGWRQPRDLTPGALSTRQQVRVWQGGESARWHAVVLTPDSISGVHWREDVNCDSCRVALPRAHVDSLQLGNPTAGFWKTTGLVFGLMMGALYVICAKGGCGYS